MFFHKLRNFAPHFENKSIMKKISTLAIALIASISSSTAQTMTTDAAWSEVIQKTLYDNGVNATVRCDKNGADKILHVTVGGNTRQYRVNNSSNQTDYSTPVYVIVDKLDYTPMHGGRINDDRYWQGERTMYRPEEVYTNPNDARVLESCLRTAIGNINRVSLVDNEFTNVASKDGAPMLIIKGSIVSIQRGETYDPIKPDAPRGTRRKINRIFAYARIHIECTDYRTGLIVWQDDFSDSNHTTYTSSDNMDGVIRNVVNKAANKLASFYPSRAPRLSVSGNITSVGEVKKDKAESVYINAGYAQELSKGDTFKVYEAVNVGSNNGMTQIGSISIAEVQGDKLSLCKVKKGEREILSAIQNGSQLIIKSDW